MIFLRRYGVLLIAPATLLMLVFFVAPLVYFLRFSLQTPSHVEFANPTLTMGNYIRFFTDSFYIGVLIRTALIAALATLMCLVLGAPVAYFISKTSPRWRAALVIMTVFPLLVGNVVRSIGWAAVLGYSGLVNSVLLALDVVQEPVNLMQTPATVTLAVGAIMLPIMILMLHASFQSVDPGIERAALSLGASPLRVFFGISLRQVIPGLIAATSLVFVVCLNAYATPILIGGSRVAMLAPQIYSTITIENNWPFAAAMASLLLVLAALVLGVFGKLMRRRFDRWRRGVEG